MTKQRLSQILKILLLPYTDQSFLKEKGDFIEDFCLHFARLNNWKNEPTAKDSREERSRAYRASRARLVRRLQGLTEFMPETLDDFRMLTDLYFPESEIAEKYCNAEHKENRHAVERYYLENIYRIAVSLLNFRDGRIAIRTWMNNPYKGERDIFENYEVFDKVQLWNQMSRLMVQDVFIVAFFVSYGL